MCIGFFQKREVGEIKEGTSEGRQVVKVTETIKTFYDELLKLGYLYKDLYDMTLGELSDTFIQRRKGLAYQLWKQSLLNTYVRDPEKYPKSPEEASPELYPPPKTYKMPEFLKNAKKERR